MPLRNPVYDVYLRPEGDAATTIIDEPIRVEVAHVDQMRGELEAHKMKLPPASEAPINFMTVCVWVALVHRMKVYGGDFRKFKFEDLLGMERVGDESTDDDGDVVNTGDVVVDPTQPDPGSGSPSPSPATTATPGSGSTQTDPLQTTD